MNATVGTAGEFPDEIGIDGAEERIAGFRQARVPGTFSSIQRIFSPLK